MEPGKEPAQLPLFFNTREHWGRLIASSAARSVRLAAGWMPFLSEADARLESKVEAALSSRNWAGLIGQFYASHHPLLERLCAAGIPVVNVSSEPPPPAVGWVHCDDFACGVMAARHFLERGYRHFAFLGMGEARFSAERKRGFVETLASEGLTNVRLLDDGICGEGDVANRLAGGLHELPKPVAVFACNDVRARHCLLAAKNAEIAVPETLAILGVDDDELQCNIAWIALSSVSPNWTGIGERAVEHLMRVVRTGSDPGRHEALAPVSVSVRQSTDHLAVEDPLAARTLHGLRARAAERLTVSTIAAELGVSLRTLERHMRQTMGLSVHTAIQNARLQRAYTMIAETRLPIGEIAAELGFSKQSHFNAAFKKRFERTPTSVRRWKLKKTSSL